MTDIGMIDKLLLQQTIDQYNAEDVEEATIKLLQAIGEDSTREGLLRTPSRVSRMYAELLNGYFANPDVIINGAVFTVESSEMVVVRDIEFHSLCEHHLLPFIGRVHVAYIPNGKVIGLSKIPRIVDMYSRRLQIQERMTHQIAELVISVLHPKGVAVVVEGLHLCAIMRGVRKSAVRMTTSTMDGVFRTDLTLRQEFMEHLARGSVPMAI